MVEHVKQSEEVSLEYMKIFEREEMLKELGREEGKTQGITIGKNEGIAIGKNEGIAIGKTQGIAVGKAEAILELLEGLGDIPEKLRSTIMNQTDIETLKEWLRFAAKAKSVEEFEKNCGS